MSMSEQKSTVYVWLVAFAAGVGGLCFGYEIGVIGQVLPMRDFGVTFGIKDPVTFKEYEGVASFLKAWITGSFTIGAFFGAAFASRCADIFSRRWSIFFSGVIFAIGGILQAVAYNLAMVIGGRAVSGVSIGIASMCVPLYISESAPTQVRGSMITVYQLMITIGIFIATAVNSGIIAAYRDSQTEWRLALGVQAVPAGILCFLMIFMPFSPRWLMYKGRDAEALNVLAKVRSADVNSDSVQQEYQHIKDSIAEEEAIGEAMWSELLVKGIFNRVIIGFLLQFFQQWTGINVILYYGPTLFKGIGFPEDQTSVSLPLANAAINIIGTFPGMYLVERVGRKKLLVYGGFVMGASHFLVCLFYGLSRSASQAYGWGAIIAVYCFILAFSSTWGPIAWVYQSEIFPLRVRAKGTGIATMSNWGWNGVVSITAPILFEEKNLDFKAYLIYGCAGVIMGLYALFMIPETMGKSLEEMDDLFGHPEFKKGGVASNDVIIEKV